jgi:hypothetical protein
MVVSGLIAGLLPFVMACVPGDGAMRAWGVVVTPTGAPIPNASLRAINGETVVVVESDETGCFLLFHLVAPGWHRFRVVAEAESYKPARRRLWANRDNLVVVTLEKLTEQGGSGIRTLEVGSENPLIQGCSAK